MFIFTGVQMENMIEGTQSVLKQTVTLYICGSVIVCFD
jgi:hypothetical protein